MEESYDDFCLIIGRLYLQAAMLDKKHQQELAEKDKEIKLLQTNLDLARRKRDE